MPTPNAKIHTPQRTKRKDFFTFHLSVKNRIANKYGIITPTDTDKPSMANFVKSAVSNNNSTVDQIKFGIYNITVENAVMLAEAGANAFVLGTSGIFRGNMAENIDRYRAALSN
jgi:hypothetical protein